MSYRYQVTFSKTFTTGLLKGMSIDNEYVRFAEWKNAEEFARRCNGKARKGLEYILHTPILEAI